MFGVQSVDSSGFIDPSSPAAVLVATENAIAAVNNWLNSGASQTEYPAEAIQYLVENQDMTTDSVREAAIRAANPMDGTAVGFYADNSGTDSKIVHLDFSDSEGETFVVTPDDLKKDEAVINWYDRQDFIRSQTPVVGACLESCIPWSPAPTIYKGLDEFLGWYLGDPVNWKALGRGLLTTATWDVGCFYYCAPAPWNRPYR
jgi:hypothetical protein